MHLCRRIIVVGLLAVGSAVAAQTVDPTLAAAIAARDKAQMARDAAGVGQYTADEYYAISPTGVLQNKQQRLDGLKQPAQPGSPAPVAARTEAIHMYGANAAVARMKALNQRQLFVWVRGVKGWQVVAAHNVPDPAPAAVTPPPPAPKAPLPSTLTAPAGLGGDEAAVFASFKQIQDAIMAGDGATVGKLMAPDYVQASRGGLVRFAREVAANITAPRVPPKYSDISVQVWDQIAVVKWQETSAQGDHNWFTRVLVKNNGAWEHVFLAISPAAKAP